MYGVQLGPLKVDDDRIANCAAVWAHLHHHNMSIKLLMQTVHKTHLVRSLKQLLVDTFNRQVHRKSQARSILRGANVHLSVDDSLLALTFLAQLTRLELDSAEEAAC